MGSGAKLASNLKKIHLAVPCSCLRINGVVRIKVHVTGTVVAPMDLREALPKKVALPGPMVATHVSSHIGQSLGMLLDGIDQN